MFPYTDTLVCAVEGCADGDTLVTARGCNISGKLAIVCVCSGHPSASNVDKMTLASAAPAAAFVNPETLHMITAVGELGAAAVDRLSSSKPDNDIKTADTVPVDGLRFEQETGALVTLKAAKRKPVMDMSLKANEFRAGAAAKDNVNSTSVEAAM